MFGIRHLASKALFTSKNIVVPSINKLTLETMLSLASVKLPEEEVDPLYGPILNPRRIEEYGRTFLDQAIKATETKHYEESNTILNKAFNILKLTFGEEHHDLFSLYATKARNCRQMKNYDEAFEYFHKALDLSHKFLSNRNEILQVYIEVCQTYTEREEWDQAEIYYEKALDLIGDESALYHDELVKLYDDMGRMFRMRDDTEKALYYHYSALAEIDNNNPEDYTMKAKILTHLAQIYAEKSDFGESLRCSKLAKELFELKDEQPEELAWCYNNMGRMYFEQQNYEAAHNSFKNAYEFESKMFSSEDLEMSESYRGMKAVNDRYMKMGELGSRRDPEV